MPRTIGRKASKLLRAYYLGPDHPMKIRFWGWFRRLTRYPRLTLPYADGGWITVDERDVVSRFVMEDGGYEPEVWDALAAFARRDEVVWDVGGNIGTVSIRAVRDPRVRMVHAFEPDPANADVLEHNLALNGSRFRVHRVALHSRTETLHLNVAPDANRGLSSLARATSTGRTTAVQGVTVDDLVFERGVDAPTLMKMDVEDWEIHVVRGARRLLAERPPRAIVLESESDASGAMVDVELRGLLEAAGYRVERLARPDATIESRENYLAVRREAGAEAA